MFLYGTNNYQSIDLLQDLHKLFGCDFHSMVKFAQSISLKIFGQEALLKKIKCHKVFYTTLSVLRDQLKITRLTTL